MQNQPKGKLIVIEGTDGSGKGTQSSLLIEYFKKHTIPFAYIDLPRYESFYGQMIARFLRGEFGNLDNVSPHLAALLFALDRKELKDEINTYLNEGKIVIANRYVSSNIAHQGSKFADESERNTFIDWLKKLEYDINGLPHEDLVIFLHVPVEIARELTQKKDERSYLAGAVDIQEKNHDHQTQTTEMYQKLAKANSEWSTIECAEHGTMKSTEEIHTMIMNELQKHSIL